jgi:lipoyl-dependent peroxiredoxin
MADIERGATAVWRGTLKEGSGTVNSDSGSLTDSSYTFVRRFGEEKGTNPEELLGAAHAACFSMALAARLSREGYTVDSVETRAAVRLAAIPSGGYKISHIHLTTRGQVQGIDAEKFAEAAEATKTGCIVSQALSAVEMSIDAQLV